MRIAHCKNTSELAQDLSKNLNLDIVNIGISKFANEETNIQINEKIKNQNILITHTLFPETNDKLVQLLLLISSLKNKGAKSVHALIPYLPYSRMDKDILDESPASRSIALLLESAGLDSLITTDLHSNSAQDFFKIPVRNITTLEVFKPILEKYINKDCIIISPDLGGTSRCKQIASFLNKPLIVLQKKRTLEGIKITGASDKIRNKRCIIIDDIISTGETILHTIKFLKASGAKSVDVMVTHNLIRYSRKLNEITSQVDNITFYDSSSLLLNSIV